VSIPFPPGLSFRLPGPLVYQRRVRPRLSRAALAFLLAAGTAAVHAGSLGHDFVNFDDALFVQGNPFVQEGFTARSVRWAFTAHLTFDAQPYLDYWQPVTVLSRLLDVELFGMDPRGHHAINILLHALNAALLFLVLESTTLYANGREGTACGRWPSAFAAALWAVHPLRVESVAWVTERKDMLAGLFWILTLAAYHRYVRRPGLLRQATVVAVFALGLMSKPFLITLPFVLLLLDYWPLRRIGAEEGWRGLPRLIAEKLPLFAMSVAATVIGIRTQARIGVLTPLEAEPLWGRIAGAAVDYVRYLFKLVWPFPMALPQPYSPEWSPGVVLASVALLTVVTLAVCVYAPRYRFLPVGWFWFVGVLVPVIGIVQPGKIPLTDRYTYLPHLGLIILVAWGIPAALPAFRQRARWMASAAACVLMACAAASVAQTRHWKDSLTLFGHAVSVTTDNGVAHANLAHVLAGEGRTAEAFVHSERAKAIRPAPAANTTGSLLAAQGRLDEAMIQYREAVRLDPRYSDAYNNLGVLLARQGRSQEARLQYEQALRYRPRHADALYNLGRLEATEGRLDEALARLASAVEANPRLHGAYYTRANLLAAAGRFPEAEADYRSALRLRPTSADTHNNLGRLLAMQGRAAEALVEYDAALRLDPDHALAQANRAELVGRPPPAAPMERP
jgi:protein O-mannosyl-transferase